MYPTCLIVVKNLGAGTFMVVREPLLTHVAPKEESADDKAFDNGAGEYYEDGGSQDEPDETVETHIPCDLSQALEASNCGVLRGFMSSDGEDKQFIDKVELRPEQGLFILEYVTEGDYQRH